MRLSALLILVVFAMPAWADDCATDPYGYNCPSSPGYCSRNPSDYTCSPSGDHCRSNPYDPSCGPNGGYCSLHPYDSDCGPTGNFCSRNPYDPSCGPTGGYCSYHPSEPACAGDGDFCRRNPYASGCNPPTPPIDTGDRPDPTPEEWARFCEKYPFMTECRSPGFGPTPTPPNPRITPQPKPKPRSTFSAKDSAWFLATISPLLKPRADGAYALKRLDCWKKFLDSECQAYTPGDSEANLSLSFKLSSGTAKRAREILREHTYEDEDFFGDKYRKGYRVRDLVCVDGSCSVER